MILQKVFIFMLSCTVFLLSAPIKPIPFSLEVDKEKVLLGKKLFFDTILSKDNTISCVTCHDLQNGGDDGLKSSFGIDGKKGVINSPTIYNSAFNFRQFWDGRARNLKEQVKGPIENPVEMGHNMDLAVLKLKSNVMYEEMFNKIYKEGVTKNNLADTIAEFEKTLITPNSPFDKYLRGDKKAISIKAEKGYKLFIDKGCIVCHNGVNVGGNLYNKFGVYEDAKSANMGRYNITKREVDKYVFKVPTLRNIDLTAPYMHDGRFDDLEEAVEFMAKYQLGRYMKKSELYAIVEFLKSLTGQIPEIVELSND